MNESPCQHKRGADAQCENDERGLSILAGLNLVVPPIKKLHQRTHEAGRQHSQDHNEVQFSAHQNHATAADIASQSYILHISFAIAPSRRKSMQQDLLRAVFQGVQRSIFRTIAGNLIGNAALQVDRPREADTTYIEFRQPDSTQCET